jgi:hypothetical protein
MVSDSRVHPFQLLDVMRMRRVVSIESSHILLLRTIIAVATAQ